MNIKLEDIKLNFSYKTVLDGVTIDFSAGRIHALLGENGAGKSSLVKILTGAVRPTGGKILLDNQEVIFNKPTDSLKHGIACVYQRPFLADRLSVRENLRIGNKNQEKNKLPQFYVCGTEIKYNKKTRSLSGDERFFVAFTSALLRNPKVLILDEPTALLNKAQSESLFVRLRSLADNGVNVIVITHKRSDLKYCDDKVLIEDGKVCNPQKIKTQKIEEKLLDGEKQASELQTLEFTISPSHLSSKMILKYRGMGNVGIIPSDRTFLASNPNLTIAQVLYPAVKKYNELNPKKEKTDKEIILEIIKKAGIAIRPEEKAFNLSGGMLQRLILERELWNNPEMIVLENPYQGLDNASCHQLKSRLDELEKNGVHIIE